jgi:hypothetical protein
MLPQPTTPRPHLIWMPKRSSTTPNRTSTTLTRTTQPQLGRPSTTTVLHYNQMVSITVSTWSFVSLYYFFLFVTMQVIIGNWGQIVNRLVNYGVVLLLVVLSLIVKSTTSVSRGNVDTKPQRRRLITQHTQQPVTSPPILQSIIHNWWCPELLHRSPKV